MSQTRTKGMGPTAFCRSKAFRSGYEEFRTGKPPRFGEWGNREIAYETGRQVAALVFGSNLPLRAIPVARQVPTDDVDWLIHRAFELRPIEKPWIYATLGRRAPA